MKILNVSVILRKFPLASTTQRQPLLWFLSPYISFACSYHVMFKRVKCVEVVLNQRGHLKSNMHGVHDKPWGEHQGKVLKGLGYQSKKFECDERASKEPLVDLQQGSDMIKVTCNISLTVLCKIDQSGWEILQRIQLNLQWQIFFCI